MKMLMGIGNADNGDDGVGPYMAEALDHDDWLALDCATAPENFTGVVRKHQPELLVLVDATNMGLAPGAVRRVARDQIEDVGIGTHMLPLTHLVDYLQDDVGEIVLIGIQPQSLVFGERLSKRVAAAAHHVLDLLVQGRVGEIAWCEERRADGYSSTQLQE